MLWCFSYPMCVIEARVEKKVPRWDIILCQQVKAKENKRLMYSLVCLRSQAS